MEQRESLFDPTPTISRGLDEDEEWKLDNLVFSLTPGVHRWPLCFPMEP